MRAGPLLLVGTLIGLALVIAATGGHVIFDSPKDAALHFFSQALEEGRAREAVIIHGRQLEVRNGTVYEDGEIISGDLLLPALRLAYAKTLARRSPILSVAGTNPEDLERAIEELETSRDHLASIQKTPHNKVLVQRSLYPIETLKALAALETARLSFLESGSLTDEAHYYEALANAVTRYRLDLRRFRDAFVATIPKGVNAYATINKIVTRESTLDTIDYLEAYMQENQALIRARISCARGTISACSALGLPPPVTALPDSGNHTGLGHAVEIKTFLTEADFRIEDTYVVELKESACVDSPFLTKTIQLDDSFKEHERIMPVGDIFFLPISLHSDIPFYAHLKERGISYILYPPSHYTCFEIAADWGRMLAVEAVREYAGRTPLSSELNNMLSVEDRETLRRYERSLRSDIVRETDALGYVAAAQMLARDGTFTNGTAYDIESLALQLQYRSTSFDRIITFIARTERINLRLYSLGIPTELEAPYLFFVRNGLLALFLQHNTSVAGATPDFFKENNLPAEQLPYIAYSAIYKDLELREELVREIRQSADLFR